MPSPLIFYSINEAFRLNKQGLPQTPVGFNYARRKFTFDESTPWKFFGWYFSLIGIFPFLTGGSCLYVIFWHFISPRPGFTIAQIVQYCMVFITCGTLCGIGITILLSGRLGILLLNQNLQAYEELMTDDTDDKNTYVPKSRIDSILEIFGIPGLHLKNGKLDIMGILYLVCLTTSTTTSRFVIFPMVVLLRLDICGFVIHDLWIWLGVWGNPIIWVIDIIIRTPLTYTFFMECQRTLPFVVFFLAMPLQLFVQSIIKLLDDATEFGRNKFLRETSVRIFKKIQLFVIIPQRLVTTQTLLLMFVGFSFLVCLNFATIRFLHYDLPFMYYMMFPILGFILTSVMRAMLPVAIDMHERSVEILRLWRHNTALQGRGKALLNKTVRAMRPLCFFAGIDDLIFYKIDKPVLGSFFSTIQDWTITLLMSYKPG
ncbi:hypothetical protein Fcan01_11452 [Folsomia candida]|uniref:Gustatory receptor n=1 Tax=Folsomia candida TaxID=158441 RepID=A0A226E9M7_FOLCA|nr:hypothetical protein Fcan01_11452 [Folsomia candida]